MIEDIYINQDFNFNKTDFYFSLYKKTYGKLIPSCEVKEPYIYEIEGDRDFKNNEGKVIVVLVRVYNDPTIKTYNDFYNIVVIPNNNKFYFEEDLLQTIKYYMEYEFLI